MEPVPLPQLEAGLDVIRAAPQDDGRLELIARRPAVDEREEVPEGELSTEEGLVGDTWRARGSRSMEDGSSDPERQLTLMNARAAALLAQREDRWSLAGDQLYVDLDLSVDNVPPGSRLAIGDAVVEITPPPHRGCAKFSRRFGPDAVRFVNSDAGKELNLRGVNAKVIVGGAIRTGDAVRKVAPA